MEINNHRGDKENQPSGFNQALKLLQETIVKIEGSYAPDTIQAYRSDLMSSCYFAMTEMQTPFLQNLI